MTIVKIKNNVNPTENWEMQYDTEHSEQCTNIYTSANGIYRDVTLNGETVVAIVCFMGWLYVKSPRKKYKHISLCVQLLLVVSGILETQL